MSAILTRRGLQKQIGDIVGTLGVCWLGGFLGAAIALSGLRLKFPLTDESLRAADLSIGIDGVRIVEALVRQGQWIFTLMAPAYAWTIPLLALSMVVLAATGNRLEAWRAAFCFNALVISSCFIAVFLPAKGLGVWFSPELVYRLPERAARYAFGRFDQFYYGADPVLGVSALEGIVTFPSFHLAMGLIVLALWRENVWRLMIAAAWFAVMLVSTLPYGGHYAVDLIGGALAWVGWFALSRKLERQPLPHLLGIKLRTAAH
jgi:membrane-associated phospholipid phosphatase